jgi:hypothetical protein
MPLKLNVGVSRKVGLPEFSSAGASCNLELELDGTLLERDLDGLQSQIRGAYAAARQAVHDELARLQMTGDSADGGTTCELAIASPQNGRHRVIDNGRSMRVRAEWPSVRRPATRSQIRAIIAIARGQDADLPRLLHEKFSVERPEDLTIRQASTLISLLKNPDSS